MLVITDIQREPPITGDLFAGKRFWIAQRCPSRGDYAKRVTYNGGQVVPLEKHADYLIVDHLRRDLPPGGISYRFIDDCIKNEVLQDPDQHGHRCGEPVGSVRQAGSAQPARSVRTQFTAKDDNDIYTWVKSCEARGVSVKGNTLYQDFEKMNNRHPWQSWRDRYIKHLEHKPPKTVAANPPPSPPSDPQHAQSARQSENTKKPARKPLEAKCSPKGKQRHVSPSPQPKPSPTYEPRSPTPAQKTPTPTRKEPTPAHAQKQSTPVRKKSTPVRQKPSPEPAMITIERFDDLLSSAEAIMAIPYGQLDAAWQQWAAHAGPPSPAGWARSFDTLVKPIYDELAKNPARSEVYDDSWAAWRAGHGDVTVDDWLTYYREVVVPQFPPPKPSESEQEIKEESDDEAKVSVSESVKKSAEAGKPPPEADQSNSSGIAGKEESAHALGKRRREETGSGLKSAVASPSEKRRNTGAEVSFASVQESIEVSPTKKSQESPARVAQEIVSVPPSPPLPSRTPPPETQQQTQSQPEMTIYEDSDGGAGHSDSEAQVRRATAHLNDMEIYDLLATFRDLPTAPKEPGDMDPYEALVMHAVHFFSQVQAEESQAVWDVGDKLMQLGVYEKLCVDEEEDEDVDEEYQEEQPDLQLEVEVVEADADAEEEQAEEWAQSEAEVSEADVAAQEEPAETLAQPKYTVEQSFQSPLPGKRDTRQQRTVSATSPSQRPTTRTTPIPQKPTTTRPTSSSNGTVMTSFDMTTEPVFDLSTEAQAEAYIASRLVPPYNFPEEHIVVALHATCANSTTMADAVLRWIRQNAGSNKKGRRSSVGAAVLPDQVGVWTDEDDRALLGGRGLEGKRVERKHGRVRCRRRREFLAEL